MKVSKKYLRELCDFVLHLNNTKQIQAAIHDLLTPQEINSIAERLRIMKVLVHQENHRSISRRLKISIGKVTRGSRVLQFGKMNWSKFFEITPR